MLDKEVIENSKKLSAPLGEIVCPHCGTVSEGLIQPFCPVCEKSFYSKELLEYTLSLLKKDKLKY